MSTTIIGRIDEMGGRIDDLEKSIADLMQQVCSFVIPVVVCLCVSHISLRLTHRPV
jgi:hypothetical protein